MAERILLCVEGNSMWPFIRSGELVVAQRTSTSELKRGDLVIYDDGVLSMHRLIKLESMGDKLIFITKGDNLPLPDVPWTEEIFIGKATALIRGGKAVYQDRGAVKFISAALAYLTYIEIIALRFALFMKRKIFGTRRLRISTILERAIRFPLKFFFKLL